MAYLAQHQHEGATWGNEISIYKATALSMLAYQHWRQSPIPQLFYGKEFEKGFWWMLSEYPVPEEESDKAIMAHALCVLMSYLGDPDKEDYCRKSEILPKVSALIESIVWNEDKLTPWVEILALSDFADESLNTKWEPRRQAVLAKYRTEAAWSLRPQTIEDYLKLYMTAVVWNMVDRPTRQEHRNSAKAVEKHLFDTQSADGSFRRQGLRRDQRVIGTALSLMILGAPGSELYQSWKATNSRLQQSIND
jgi:hypothetical protein